MCRALTLSDADFQVWNPKELGRRQAHRQTVPDCIGDGETLGIPFPLVLHTVPAHSWKSCSEQHWLS